MSIHKSVSSPLTPSQSSRWGLNLLIFLISDVRHGIGPLLALYLRHSLDWNAAKIGTALALAELGGFLSQIPAGLLADSLKSKRSIIVTACLNIIVGCLVIRFFPHLMTIMLAQFIMGISIALIPSAIGAITLGLFGRGHFPVRVSQNEMWNHAGNLFTTLTIGLMSYLWGYEWIFYILIIFSILSILALRWIRPSEIHYNVARELLEDDFSNTQNKPLPLAQLLKRFPVIIFNLSLFFYYLANGAQIILVGQLLTIEDNSYSAIFISASLIIAEITMIFIAYLMSKFINNANRKTFFLIAFFILPLRALLYTTTYHPTYLLCIQVLDGVAAGILGVIGGVINSDLAVNTGRFNFLQGLGSLSISLGEAFSQIFAGLVTVKYGLHYGFFFLATVAIIGALFFLIWMPETKETNK